MSIRVNETERSTPSDARESVLDALREDLER